MSEPIQLSTEMRQYKEYIESLAADKGKDVVFYNSGEQHAAIVMSTMFNHAEKCVKIYAGGFTGQVSGNIEYKDGLEKFLKKGGELQVLLQQSVFDPIKTPKIFELIKFYHLFNSNKIQIKTHPFKVRRNPESNEFHFAIADDHMYRIEDNIQTFTAEGNFNDPKETKSMSELFDKIFSSEEAKSIDLN